MPIEPISATVLTLVGLSKMHGFVKKNVQLANKGPEDLYNRIKQYDILVGKSWRRLLTEWDLSTKESWELVENLHLYIGYAEKARPIQKVTWFFFTETDNSPVFNSPYWIKEASVKLCLIYHWLGEKAIAQEYVDACFGSEYSVSAFDNLPILVKANSIKRQNEYTATEVTLMEDSLEAIRNLGAHECLANHYFTMSESVYRDVYQLKAHIASGLCTHYFAVNNHEKAKSMSEFLLHEFVETDETQRRLVYDQLEIPYTLWVDDDEDFVFEELDSRGAGDWYY